MLQPIVCHGLTFHPKDKIKFSDKSHLKINIVGHWTAHKTINDKKNDKNIKNVKCKNKNPNMMQSYQL